MSFAVGIMSRLDDYRLDCPTKESALAVYTEAFDEGRAELLWREACTATEIGDDDTSIHSLEKIFEYLSKKPGADAIYGLSLKVRLLTYKNILKVQQGIPS